MRTNDENKKLAELLFPDVTKTVNDILEKYPQRNVDEGAMVLRFAPSPTGFLHIGGVFTSLISTWLARQTKGISILRIEDTDKNREVENGVSLIVNGLNEFGISFDEGMLNEEEERGDYGPYMQSKRLDIYHVFAKDLVEKGYAYPCFLSEEELEDIRKKQTELGVRTGCYCDWAKWKDASFNEISEKLNKGEKYVIRLNSTGDFERTFELTDLVKGRVTLHQNDMNAVLLKSDGFPTYHFAHPIDDTLMGITYIFRGDEWFSSVPLHVELFEKLGFKLIPYVHISPLMKMENGGKRKLSKRKDPEASIEYYSKHGYPTEGFIEYLLNLANSNFYDWRKQNPDKDLKEFHLSVEKLNKSGALFDIVKLDDTCKEYIATLSAEDLYNKALNWAEKYHKELHTLLAENREYSISILNIERTGNKIRKDIVKYEDIYSQFKMFFDELMEFEDISDRIAKDEQVRIVKEYLSNYFSTDDSDAWFENIKKISRELGYCDDRKEYELHSEKYKGVVGDVAMVLRVALTGRTKTPDLCQVMTVLGEKKVKERLEQYISKMI